MHCAGAILTLKIQCYEKDVLLTVYQSQNISYSPTSPLLSEQPGWGRPDEANALYASFQECGRQPACQGQCRSAIDMIMMLMTVQMPPLLFFVANMLVRFSFDQWYDYDIHNDRANGPSLNKECYCKHALQSQCGSVLWLWILLLLKMEFHCKRLTPRKWPVEFKEKLSTAFRCSVHPIYWLTPVSMIPSNWLWNLRRGATKESVHFVMPQTHSR